MSMSTLALNAFEQLMLSQDSPEYPCVIFARMKFAGRIDRPAFARSLKRMLERHPLLASGIQFHRRRAFWDSRLQKPLELIWTDEAPTTCWIDDGSLDLSQSAGLRVFVHDLSDECCVLFQCHHTSADGLGLFQAIEDLWLIYDGELRDRAHDLPRLDDDALPSRNRFGLTFRKILSLLPKQVVGLLGVRQYLMRRPVPVLPHQPIPPHSQQPLPVTAISYPFAPNVVDRLRAAAREQNFTINDLVAASVFIGLSDFRNQQRVQKPTDWLRMMVPINMRNKISDAAFSACNIVSSVFLDRTPQQISDVAGLLKSIHEEMELIKRNQLELMFSFSLWVRSKLRGNKISFDRPSTCQTSVVFTNLGRAYAQSPLTSPKGELSTGGLVLKNLEILAPLTPHLSAAFSLLTYAGQLSLTLNYDSRFLTTSAAHDLLNRVARAAESICEIAPPSVRSDDSSSQATRSV